MSFQGYLKQSTSTTIKLGPMVDSTDGNTEETALTIDASDVELSKAGGAFAAKSQASGLTHDSFGYYDCMLDTTDTNTVGDLKIVCHPTGALIVTQTYHVIEETVYDSLFATSADFSGIADAVLSRGVDNVEDTADKKSLTRVVLATQGWETVSSTGLRINKTDGTEFDIIPITTGTNNNLVTSIG